MSIQGNPFVIHDSSLVLSLDAANSKSYVSGSSTWSDLSGYANHATGYGPILLSTDGNGCFDFSGATGANAGNSSIGFTFASNMVQTTGNFTFECWIKNPPAAGQTGMFSNAGGGDGYRFGPGYNGIYYLIGPNYTESVIAWSSNLTSTLWYHVVATWDRTSAYRVNAYLNGTYQNYGSVPTTQTAFASAAPGIVRSACCGIYTGKLAMMNVYNKSLTASEVLQNYNSAKSRFGL